jgi:hypothetical protein
MLSRSRRRARRTTALFAAATALTAGLALSGPAHAAPDLLSGGSVNLQLTGSKKLKLNPRTLNLSIIRGMVDPVTGGGEISVAGTVRVKSGKRKARVLLKTLVLGPSGGPGLINAEIGEDEVEGFATLTGGTATRQGFGANITGITATLGPAGAQALNEKFRGGKKKKKGKKGGASTAAKKKKRGGRVKGGLPLGTISATTIPKTVEVLPGGSMVLHTDLALVGKLLFHCVNGLPPFGGVDPVAPATFDPLGASFTFPVTGGNLAPDFTDGSVRTAGGQRIVKNLNGLPGPIDCSEPPAVGTTLLQTGLSAEFASNALAGTATLPDGVALQATIGDINWATGTRSFNSATNEATITGATVTLNYLAALTLNSIFPNRSGDPNNDFTTADVLGTLDLTAKVR